MTSRELPVEEWGRLDDLPLPAAAISPEHCAAAVVEQDGAIVGCAVAMTLVHGDLWWIDPKYRRTPGVIAALLAEFFAMLRTRGLACTFITAPGPEIAELLEKMGGSPQGTIYLVPVPLEPS